MLQGVVQRGTGAYRCGPVGKPLAGKTGTSSDAKDTWFVGFSPDLAAGVFVGFDNPRTLGRHEQGATVAAPIFRDFMKERAGGCAAHAFPRRAGHRGSVDRLEERLSGSARNAGRDPGSFKAGSAPGEANAPSAGMDESAPGTVANSTNSTPAASVGEGTGGLY